MSGHRFGQDALDYTVQKNAIVRDPGDGKTINVNKNFGVCLLTCGASGESRVLPPAAKLGVGTVLTVFMKTSGGGAVTITDDFANQYSILDGQTGAYWRFIVVQYNNTLSWLGEQAMNGLTATPTEVNVLDGITATTNELNMAADISVNSEIVITTNVISPSEAGKTFYLTLAGGFTSTLPVPLLGSKLRFVVAVAPTTAYIITTNAGANILYGHMLERAGTAGVAGAARDTFNFVANNAIIGDWVEFESDGTNWYYHGMVDVAAGNTVAVT